MQAHRTKILCAFVYCRVLYDGTCNKYKRAQKSTPPYNQQYTTRKTWNVKVMCVCHVASFILCTRSVFGDVRCDTGRWSPKKKRNQEPQRIKQRQQQTLIMLMVRILGSITSGDSDGGFWYIMSSYYFFLPLPLSLNL